CTTRSSRAGPASSGARRSSRSCSCGRARPQPAPTSWRPPRSSSPGSSSRRRSCSSTRASAAPRARPTTAGRAKLRGGDDLGAVFDAHVRWEFVLRDADAAVATMIDDAYLNHVPVATGARGREAIRRFYDEVFIPSWPDDVDVTTVSRTIGENRLVDELLV